MMPGPDFVDWWGFWLVVTAGGVPRALKIGLKSNLRNLFCFPFVCHAISEI
jgi:hypothetical protein